MEAGLKPNWSVYAKWAVKQLPLFVSNLYTKLTQIEQVGTIQIILREFQIFTSFEFSDWKVDYIYEPLAFDVLKQKNYRVSMQITCEEYGLSFFIMAFLNIAKRSPQEFKSLFSKIESPLVYLSKKVYKAIKEGLRAQGEQESLKFMLVQYIRKTKANKPDEFLTQEDLSLILSLSVSQV